jgi:multiple sugar transport system substrate-binding protein
MSTAGKQRFVHGLGSGRLSRRRVVAGVAALGLSATAAGGPPTFAAAAPRVAQGENERRVVEMWVREYYYPLLSPAVDAYNERLRVEGTDVEVRLTEIVGGDFNERFTAAVSANEAPDIVSMDLIYVPYYNSVGAFLDVTDRFNVLEYKDALNPAALSLGRWQDKVYALPFAVEGSVLFFNKGMFRDAGLDPERPPANWDELLRYAQAMTGDDRYGYAFAGDAGALMFTVMPYVWANGGQWLNEDGTKAAIDDPETIASVQFFADLIQQHKVAPQGTPAYTWDDFTNAFLQERAGMVVSGSFLIGSLRDDHPDLEYGTTTVFSRDGTARSSFVGGDLIAIPASSRFPDDAWNFVQYLMSSDVQVEQFAKNGVLPNRSDFADNPYFASEPAYAAFASALQVGYTPFTTKYNELLNPFVAAMQEALGGDKPVEQAMKDGAAAMQSVLDQG